MRREPGGLRHTPLRMSFFVRVRSVLDELRRSLWFLPSISMAAAVIVSSLLVAAPDAIPISDRLLFVGDQEAARGLMQVLAGSTITVTGLVFTLTVVSLQVASGQYSPRLISNFLSDVGNQIVLSLFLGTFAYALAVLRSLPSGDTVLVPRLAITVGMALAAAALISLVYFLNHMAQSIRVETILHKATRKVLTTIEDVFPEPLRPNEPELALPAVPDTADAIYARRSGYVQAMSSTVMLRTVIDQDAVLRVRPTVGEYVVKGATLAWAWGRTDRLQTAQTRQIGDAVHDAVSLGQERTHLQDIAFGLRQIVDVISRALSPGVNDPTTAVDALGHLGEPLADLARRHISATVQQDEDGVQRVVIPALVFEDFLELACGQPRRYGKDEPAVLGAILRMLGEVIDVTESDRRRQAVVAQVKVLLDDAERALDSPHDLQLIQGLALRLIGDLTGSPSQQGARLG